jgi:hypothetical protein
MAPTKRTMKRKNRTRRKKLPRKDFIGKAPPAKKQGFFARIFATTETPRQDSVVAQRIFPKKESYAALITAPRGNGIVICRCCQRKLEDCPNR